MADVERELAETQLELAQTRVALLRTQARLLEMQMPQQQAEVERLTALLADQQGDSDPQSNSDDAVRP